MEYSFARSSAGLAVQQFYYVAFGDACVAKSDIIYLRDYKSRRAKTAGLQVRQSKVLTKSGFHLHIFAFAHLLII
jgi:hypothetical protein